MNMPAFFGNLSLNISCILYIISYIPQIIHNQKSINISGLSLWLHFLLYISYSFDLLYGFAINLPWQYKVVSIVSVFLINIQHIQFIKFFKQQQLSKFIKCWAIFLIITFILMYYILHLTVINSLSDSAVFLLGIISRFCGLIYIIPQLIKNQSLQSTKGINQYFAYLNLFLVVLDTISAWCLDWGWILKISSPITMILMFNLILQYKKYNKLYALN